MKNKLTESEPIPPPHNSRVSSHGHGSLPTAGSAKQPKAVSTSPWYLEASHQQPSSCLICSDPICDNFLVFPLCGHAFHWICLQSNTSTASSTESPSGFVCPVCDSTDAVKTPPQSEPQTTGAMGGDAFSSIPQSVTRPREFSLFYPSKSDARSSDTRNIVDFCSFDPLALPPSPANSAEPASGRETGPYFMSGAQLAKFKLAQRKLRTKLSLQQDALVRWKALAESLQQQRDDLSIDLQRALDEIRRIAEMEMKRSEMFRQTLQDQEDRFLTEIARWEVGYNALHQKYEKTRQQKRALARRLRMYMILPVQKERRGTSCSSGIAKLREDMNVQLKRLNAEVGYVSRMMKILDTRVVSCARSNSTALVLPSDRKLSLVVGKFGGEESSIWLPLMPPLTHEEPPPTGRQEEFNTT